MLLPSGGRPYLRTAPLAARNHIHTSLPPASSRSYLPSDARSSGLPAIAENHQCDATGADAQQADRAGDADTRAITTSGPIVAVTRSVEAIPATSPTAVP